MTLEWVLKGGEADDRYPIPDEWRDYILATKFGWTKSQIDEQPAVWLDWMINIGSTVESAKAKNANPGNNNR